MVWSIVTGTQQGAGFRTTDKIMLVLALINSLTHRPIDIIEIILNMNNVLIKMEFG